MKINIINNNEIFLNYFITDTSYEFNIPYIDENHELLFGSNNNLKCLTVDNIEKIFKENNERVVIIINEFKYSKEEQDILISNCLLSLYNGNDFSNNFLFNSNILNNEKINFTCFSNLDSFENICTKNNFNNLINNTNIKIENFIFENEKFLSIVNQKIHLLSDKNINEINEVDLIINDILDISNFPELSDDFFSLSSNLNDINFPILNMSISADINNIKLILPDIKIEHIGDLEIDLSNVENDLKKQIDLLSLEIQKIRAAAYLKCECYDPTIDVGLSDCNFYVNDKILNYQEILSGSVYGGPIYVINENILPGYRKSKNYNFDLKITKPGYVDFNNTYKMDLFLDKDDVHKGPFLTNLGTIPLMPTGKVAFFTLAYGFKNNKNEYVPSDIDLHLYTFESYKDQNDLTKYRQIGHTYYANRWSVDTSLDHDDVDFGSASETITITKYSPNKNYYYLCTLHNYSGENYGFNESAGINIKIGTIKDRMSFDVFNNNDSSSRWFDLCLLYHDQDENVVIKKINRFPFITNRYDAYADYYFSDEDANNMISSLIKF